MSGGIEKSAAAERNLHFVETLFSAYDGRRAIGPIFAQSAAVLFIGPLNTAEFAQQGLNHADSVALLNFHTFYYRHRYLIPIRM